MKRAALYGLGLGLIVTLTAEVVVQHVAWKRFHQRPLWVRRTHDWGRT